MAWLQDNFGAAWGTLAMPGAGTLLGSEVDKMRAQNRARNEFDPYSGMPGYPGFVAMDPNFMYMGDEAARAYGGAKLNTAPMDKFTMEAMREGPSRAGMLAQKAQAYGATRSIENAKKQAAGEAATARTQLAMRGGAGAGTAERLAKNANNRALELGQNARDTAARNSMQISMEDEDNRIKMLGQAPAMQVSAAQLNQNRIRDILDFKKADIDRYANETGRATAYNMNQYNQAMSAWAAGKQAQATQNSGKK